MKHSFRTNLILYLIMTILCGVLYPLFVYVLGTTLFHQKATGSFIQKNGVVIGSELIGQKFEHPKYFWSRPSATDYNPLPSGASNFSQTSADLLNLYHARQKLYGEHAPQHLLFASGSGLDPQIDLNSALFQINRVAKHRGVSEQAIHTIVMKNLEHRELWIFGEQKVNVLKLNLSLDEILDKK